MLLINKQITTSILVLEAVNLSCLLTSKVNVLHLLVYWSLQSTLIRYRYVISCAILPSVVWDYFLDVMMLVAF